MQRIIMKSKEIKFGTVFNWLIVAFIICVIGIQSYMMYNVNSMVGKSNTEYLTSVSNSIEYELNNKIDILNNTSRSVALNKSLQTFLTTKDSNEKTYSQQLVKDRLFEMNTDISKFLGSAVIDTEGKLTVLNNVAEDDVKAIMETYDEYKSGNLRNGIYFKVMDGVLSAYKYEDVFKYNLSYAERSNVGTVIMVDQINLLELSMKLNILDSIDAILSLKGKPASTQYLYSKKDVYKNIRTGRTINISDSDWTVDVNMYNRHISFDYMTMLGTNIVLIVLTVIFIIILVFAFYKMYTKPMLRLTKYLNDYSLGGKNEVLENVGIKEFNVLLKHINDMFVIIKKDAHKIVHTQEMLYEEELEKQKVLLYMYQLQIQPHFLYNTLGCINYFALEHNAPEIVQMIDALTGILRYSAEYSFESSITKEIKYTQWYMKIIDMRYPDKVNLSIDVSDELLDMSIPSMSLQPLVENAFKHGILLSADKGDIWIRIYSDGEYAFIEIEDDGVGMTAEQCDKLNKRINEYEIQDGETCRIGLANVNKRMKLKFGENCDMMVVSELGKFTKVSIKIKLNIT